MQKLTPMKRIFVITLLLMAGILFAIPVRGQILDGSNGGTPQDGFYEKVNTQGRKPRPYVPVREADVFIKWRVWRVIDLRLKMNQYLYFPTETTVNPDRKSLTNLIFEGIESGEIIPYKDDFFSEEFTMEEYRTQLEKTVDADILGDFEALEGTESDENNEAAGNEITNYYTAKDILMYRIKEEWFIDKQRGVRDIRIIGIAPVLQKETGIQDVCWLYYPHLRELFAKTEAFNPRNSAMRQSYDDVFAWNRYFQSYIYKIDNLQNQTVEYFYPDIKTQLRESDRIEEMLFEIEHDLWVY